MFTIDDFWMPLLSAPARGVNGTPVGWTHVESELPTFMEAPIRPTSGFGDATPAQSGVILVSAPGAVGKSTLAHQISFKTGAMLLDLAKAAPVGANTLVGGLAKTRLYQSFQNGSASLIIDGLDEARMRVKHGGYAAFMDDVVSLIDPNHKPLILFGRTGAVEYAWLYLSDKGIEPPVLEIGYFNQSQAAEFTKVQVKISRGDDNIREPDARAVDMLLSRMRTALQTEKDPFSGYAPVLIALAKRVFDPDNPNTHNTQAFIARLEKDQEPFTLTGIADSIMRREQEKIKSLPFQDKTLREKLYTPEEQIARLLHHLYEGMPNIPVPHMTEQDRPLYDDALETWVLEHPFLDGTGRRPSSVVFEGLLVSKALQTEGIAEFALDKEFDRGVLANPFLSEFYMLDLGSTDSTVEIPAEHIGILYASLIARLAQGEAASLRIDGEIDEEDQQNDTAEGEIVKIYRSGDYVTLVSFSTDRAGHFRFGLQIEGVDIIAPESQISIGRSSGENEIVFVAPISVDAGKMNLNADNIIVRPSPSQGDIEFIVSLQSEEVHALPSFHRPICQGASRLEVFGSGFQNYPWPDFIGAVPNSVDPEIDEPLQRLKRILRLFRAHGGGDLAKYRDAIKHRRRTRGSGQKVLDRLLKEKVLRREGRMYYLDPGRFVGDCGVAFSRFAVCSCHSEHNI